MDWSFTEPKPKNTELPPLSENTAVVRSRHYLAILNISASPENVEAEALRRLVQMARRVRDHLKLSAPSDKEQWRHFFKVSDYGDGELYFPLIDGLESTDADYLLRFLWQQRHLTIPGLKNVAPRIQ
jgi:hypothetical protein